MSIFLIQTDTTIGFLSAKANRLADIKNRPATKAFLKVYPSLKKFKSDKNRVPKKFKNLVRRSHKTTFVIKNLASRVVKESYHLKFLKKYDWLYSTSANKHGCCFDKNFCFNNSDIIVEDFRGLKDAKPSKIYKLSNKSLKRIR